MAEFIDPSYDPGFKLIFGRPGISDPLLISLLNSIFVNHLDIYPIESVEYLSNEDPGESVRV